jgi:2-desacetyl-2-hydroxyethyl bacteriochlorophyllide A dehydrogenase
MDMKALVIEKPGLATIKSVSIPPVGDYEVLIKVKASGICGTDVHIYRGDYLGSYPIVPGHELSGIIEKAGAKVTRFKPGDCVAVEPNIACNNCHPCLNNRQNHCENWNAIGVTLPGGMAEYTVVPENAAFNIGDLPFIYGALVEPLSCVIHGVERSNIKLGDKVLILGAGPIDILLSKMILLQGASEITQIDKNKSRLDLAKQNGATYVFSSLDEISKEAYDVVVDASGVASLMEQAIYFARKSGTILFFGVPKKNVELKIPAFHILMNELSLVTTYTSVRNSIQAVRLLQTGTLDVSAMVSHQLLLEDFVKGVETIEQGKEGVLKVVICPEL